MTQAAEAKPTPWKMHEVKDPARIPSHLLTNEQASETHPSMTTSTSELHVMAYGSAGATNRVYIKCGPTDNTLSLCSEGHKEVYLTLNHWDALQLADEIKKVLKEWVDERNRWKKTYDGSPA